MPQPSVGASAYKPAKATTNLPVVVPVRSHKPLHIGQDHRRPRRRESVAQAATSATRPVPQPTSINPIEDAEASIVKHYRSLDFDFAPLNREYVERYTTKIEDADTEQHHVDNGAPSNLSSADVAASKALKASKARQDRLRYIADHARLHKETARSMITKDQGWIDALELRSMRGVVDGEECSSRPATASSAAADLHSQSVTGTVSPSTLQIPTTETTIATSKPPLTQHQNNVNRLQMEFEHARRVMMEIISDVRNEGQAPHSRNTLPMDGIHPPADGERLVDDTPTVTEISTSLKPDNEHRVAEGNAILPRRYYDTRYERLLIDEPVKISQPSLVPPDALKAVVMATKTRRTMWPVSHRFGYEV